MAKTDLVAAALDAIRQREQAATPGPWWSDEDALMYRLHGVAFRAPPLLDGQIPEQVVSKQIAKAPKMDTPYAEYWPDAADDAFITHARSDVPRLLAVVDAVLALTRDTDGNNLPPTSEIPVGEFQAAISRALLGEGDSNA